MGRQRKGSQGRMNANINDAVLAYPFHNPGAPPQASTRPHKKTQNGLLPAVSCSSEATPSQQYKDIRKGEHGDLPVRRPRRLLFYRNGDRYYRGKRLRITPNRFQTFDSLLSELTKHMSLPYGVRKIYDPQSGKLITDIENLIDGESYVCASFEKFKKMPYGANHSTPDWSIGPASKHHQLQSDLYGRFSYSYPSTGKYAAAYASPGGSIEPFKNGGSGPVSFTFPGMKKPPPSHHDKEQITKSTGLLQSDLNPVKPRLCKIIKAGPKPQLSVSLLLNKRSVLSFEALLQDISDAFGFAKYKSHKIRRLFKIDGIEVKGVADFFRSPDEVFIASASKQPPTKEEVAKIYSENFSINAYAYIHKKRIKGKDDKNYIGLQGDEDGDTCTCSLTVVKPRKAGRGSKDADIKTKDDDSPRKAKEEMEEEDRNQEKELRLKEEELKRRQEREDANRKKEEELRQKEEELKRREEELKKQIEKKQKESERVRLEAVTKKEAELKTEEIKWKEEEQRQREFVDENLGDHQEKGQLEESENKDKISIDDDEQGNSKDSKSPEDVLNNELQSLEEDVTSEKKCRSFISQPRAIVEKDSILERYTIGPKIGDGNFADVHEATMKDTKELFAMKIVDKSKLYGKEHMMENEIGIMKNINHPNIVKLYEEHETIEHIYLVMELVRGGDLFDAITESVKFTEADAAIIIGNMASALAYLHGLKIVHRDLKPENLLVSRSSGDITLKLADFGLAMEVKAPIFTVCGTPTYVAPEILTEIGYGLEVDMWATGVICYILLCGFPPFRSVDRDQEELFELIQAGEFVYLSPYWDNISDDAKDLINHLLVVSRRKRYTAQQVLDHPWVLRGRVKVETLPNLQREVSINLEKNFDGRKSGKRKNVGAVKQDVG